MNGAGLNTLTGSRLTVSLPKRRLMQGVSAKESPAAEKIPGSGGLRAL
jgi:hypothetical protein